MASASFPPASSADRRQALGRRGEEAAAHWYLDAGYQIVARNWRCRDGEIDIVARAPGGAGIVICEVKTRSSSAYGHPTEAVTAVKQRRLRRLAARWLDQHRKAGGATGSVRFDVASVMVEGSDRLVVAMVPDAF
jgi:putative endonuclease